MRKAKRFLNQNVPVVTKFTKTVRAQCSTVHVNDGLTQVKGI
jgi:hypothetical protein